MDAKVRERQIERAWIKHDPSRAKIPQEAWRALRNFKKQIAPQAARVAVASAARDRIKGLMADYSRKGDVGRQRTFAKLKHHFYPATVERLKAGILWSWLEPRSAMLADPNDPGEEQNAILTRYGLVWVRRKREFLGYQAFSLEIPDHCTGRMLQRSPGLDIRAALHEAHHALFQASSEVITAHVVDGAPFYLPCAEGLLICSALRADTRTGTRFVFGRARTWIAANMLGPDQYPIAAAPTATQSQLTVMTMLALDQAGD
jgi:hypothetical protein